MKSEAVNCWIKHWLQLQNKGKRPLVLKNTSDKQQKSSDVEGRLTSKHKGKMKATETADSESDNVDKPADGTVNVDDDISPTKTLVVLLTNAHSLIQHVISQPHLLAQT